MKLERAVNRMYPPTSPVRQATIALMREGYLDIMPDRIKFVPWHRFRTAEMVGSDIYFVTKLSSSYFPCVMNNNPDYGRLLVDMANELSAGKEPSNSDLPVILPESAHTVAANGQGPANPPRDPGVWPPPPSVP